MQLIATLALWAAASAPAAATPADRLRALSDTDNLALELVTDLTTRIGPRPAGSLADRKAREWAVARMKALGFSNVREEIFQTPAWVRGREQAQILTPNLQPLVIVGLGRSVGTPKGGIIAPVTRVDSLTALKLLPAKALAGKIAFIDGKQVTPSRIGGDYGEASARIYRSAAEAARKGAIAVLVRSASSSTNRFAHTGALRYEDGITKIPAAAIPNADADQLTRLLQGSEVRVRLEMEPQTVPSALSGNVIAEIPGTDLAEEFVLLGAHLDSWDQGTGALDDGAGVANVIAAAKAIMALPIRPRRSIRIVLFGAEEINLAGAAAYAKTHGGERHAIATESDFGAARIWAFYTGVPEAMLPQVEKVQQELAPLGIERGHNRASGGEDLGPLKSRGIPVASLVQDGTNYFDYHHSANDTLDKIDPAALRQNVAAFAVFAWLMANP